MKRTYMRNAAAAFALAVPAVAAEPQRGVTDNEIVIGTYTDLSGVTAMWGVNNSNSWRLVFDQVNEAGGINGRKIVPTFAAVDPLGTAGAATACTQLTEDDKVFLTMGFFQAPDVACYLDTHATPIIGVSLRKSMAETLRFPSRTKWLRQKSHRSTTNSKLF